LFFQARDFEATHNLHVPLNQSGRFLYCFSHSRVVRCDFTEG
jgi:hypothetical protein